MKNNYFFEFHFYDVRHCLSVYKWTLYSQTVFTKTWATDFEKFGTPIRTLSFAQDGEIKAEDNERKQNSSEANLTLILGGKKAKHLKLQQVVSFTR